MKSEMQNQKSRTKRILVVDDNENNRVLLETILKDKGYTVVGANNGKQALEVAAHLYPDMIISDILMPEIDGFELCRTIKADKQLRNIPIVVFSATYTDSKDKELAISLGATDFISKPIDIEKFIENIEIIFENRKDSKIPILKIPKLEEKELKQMHENVLVNKLSDKVKELENEIIRRKQAEQQINDGMEKLKITVTRVIDALALTVELRDPYTAGHQQRVSKLACVIAKEMGIPNDQIEGLRMAGIVHDIGKINVPAEILSKPGKLTKDEFNIMKSHSKAGYDILIGIEFPWSVADIVYQHHERMDGSGYPLGLFKSDILMGARIICVADVVEAMVSHRPYRPALGDDMALGEIAMGKGVRYDSCVVDACLKTIKKNGLEFEDL